MKNKKPSSIKKIQQLRKLALKLDTLCLKLEKQCPINLFFFNNYLSTLEDQTLTPRHLNQVIDQQKETLLNHYSNLYQ